MGDPDQKVEGGTSEGQVRKIHSAAAVAGEPRVAKVDVTRRIRQDAAVDECRATVGRVGKPGKVGACGEECQAVLRVVEPDRNVRARDGYRRLALCRLVWLMTILGRIVDPHVRQPRTGQRRLRLDLAQAA